MMIVSWSPTGKARGTHFTPQWGDIPRLTSGQAGQKWAHSSTARDRACTLKCVMARRRDFLLPG